MGTDAQVKMDQLTARVDGASVAVWISGVGAGVPGGEEGIGNRASKPSAGIPCLCLIGLNGRLNATAAIGVTGGSVFAWAAACAPRRSFEGARLLADFFGAGFAAA